MTQNTKYSVIAFLSGIAVGGLLFFLELAGVDWAGLYRKWFDFVLWTGFLFGLLGFAYGRRLKRAKPLALFLSMLVLHAIIFVVYLRSIGNIPGMAFLLLAPLEAGFVGLVMGTLGGTRLPRGYRAWVRREKWPPTDWHGDPGTVRKRDGPK